MNTTQLAVEMTVYAKENKSIWNITKDKPYKLLEPRNNFYKGAVFGFIDDLGLERIIGIKLLNKYFTTTPPDQKIKQQALAQCDEALKLNSQIGNFGKPNDKDNKPDQEGCSSGLLNGFNDGLHRSSGIGGQSPELSTLDQEGKREEEIETHRVIFQFKATPEKYGIKEWDAKHSGMAEEYAVVKVDYGCGIMTYGKYHNEWNANPSERYVIKHLMDESAQLQSRVKELEGLNEAAEKHIEIITRERDWQTDVVVPDLEQQIAALKQENERLRGLIKGLVNENERIAKLAKVDPIMKCEKPVPCTDGHDVSEGSSTCSKCGERYIHNPTHRPDKR